MIVSAFRNSIIRWCAAAAAGKEKKWWIVRREKGGEKKSEVSFFGWEVSFLGCAHSEVRLFTKCHHQMAGKVSIQKSRNLSPIEEEEDDDDEPSPREQIIGCIERGLGYSYRELEGHWDQLPKFSYWGAIYVDGLSEAKEFEALQNVVESRGGIVIDNTKTGLVVRFPVESYFEKKKHDVRTPAYPFFIAEGNMPCIFSVTELQKSPVGKWYHFEFSEQRSILKIIDELYIAAKAPKIYLLVNLLPSAVFVLVPRLEE